MNEPKLKVGDEVAVFSGYGDIKKIVRVTRITKSFVQLSDGSKWCHDFGSYPKKDRDLWHNRRIERANVNLKIELMRSFLIRKIKGFVPHSISTNGLEKIYQTMREVVEKEIAER
jgi:hypothetical protein